MNPFDEKSARFPYMDGIVAPPLNGACVGIDVIHVHGKKFPSRITVFETREIIDLKNLAILAVDNKEGIAGLVEQGPKKQHVFFFFLAGRNILFDGDKV